MAGNKRTLEAKEIALTLNTNEINKRERMGRLTNQG